jgi:hypothetical protein
LRIGDKYIAFPLPGDNDGHGGYRRTEHIFQKIEKCTKCPIFGQSVIDVPVNAVRMKDGILSYAPDSMPVIRVE